jgi:NAD(P)-dependent dehydrogenase (short-subunit alcohol dehydrogenase family)
MAVSIVAPPGTGTPNTVPRAALVTGAGKRIGRGIALGMARAGWDVAVHFGRSSADADETVRQVQALGRRAQAFGADLESESQTRSMFEAAAAAFPALSCVVNNASRFEPDTPATFSFAALDHHLRPNLAAPVLLAQLLHARLAPAHASPPAPEHPPVAGVVINLLDQKLDNPNPDFFSYTLTKAGLLAATHIMAMAFAPVLRVAGVSPGITLKSGDQSDEGFAAAHTKTPLGRSSRLSDVVDAVVYLADASAITGVNLLVDGGQHLLPLARDVMYLTPDRL